MMSEVKDNKADVEITTTKGGHAIGGLCGYSGTHSIGDVAAATGIETIEGNHMNDDFYYQYS